MAGQHFRERALAGAVRAHDRVDFALGHGQAQAPDDLLFRDGGV